MSFEADIAYLESLRAPEHPVVFYGSSSITMWHSLADDICSDRVVNRGFGGSTLRDSLAYFDRLIAPLAPSAAVLYVGDNDLVEGQRPWAVLDSFHELLARLGPIPVGVLGIKPSPARWTLIGRIREVNRGMEEVLACRAAPSYFIDTIAPMLGGDGRPNREFFLDDGVHLSRRGYLLWASLLAPYREALLFGLRQEGLVGESVE